MRTTIIATLLLTISFLSTAQRNDIGWIAPEGKIINYRTLTWNDFQDKEDRRHAEDLARRGLQAAAYVSPAIYITPDGPAEELENGKIKFKFKVKCAFQSHAFVRNTTREAHTNYVLTHEQDHYDIALNYARMIHDSLANREFSPDRFKEEIYLIYHGMMEVYDKLQDKYDAEVNPQGKDDVAMQTLWDMRIKKCLDLATDKFYNSPENDVKNVRTWGQLVKRLPNDDMKKFCTRTRPIYTEFHDENAAYSKEITEWSNEQATVAFFTQRYYIEEEGKPTKDCSRLVAYLYTPTKQPDMYKRSFIDTFCIDDKAPKITAVFFANADSDGVRELIIQSSLDRKDRTATGKHYCVTAYDNVAPFKAPARIKRIPVSSELENGFEGMLDGKQSKAKFKTEKEITEALKLSGYSEVGAPVRETKKIIRQ